jgi:parallel beta-helix repeat protein
MRRTGTVFVVLVSLLFVAMLREVNVPMGKANGGGTIYIRADGGIDPQTAPISSPDNVTYTFTGNAYQPIVIERDNIVLDGANYVVQGTGFTDSIGLDISERINVTIRTLKVEAFYHGVLLNGSSSCCIDTSNVTTNIRFGVWLYNCSNCVLDRNNLVNNENGVWLWFCSNDTISENQESENEFGVRLDDSSNNTISGNRIADNKISGIFLSYSSDNTFSGNDIADNPVGVLFEYLGSNRFCHNNFINNAQQAHDRSLENPGIPTSTNIWNDGNEGNYWSDYTGTDANHDGIGDSPYVIDANNMDGYPLMAPYIIEFPSLPILLLFMISIGVVFGAKRKTARRAS